MAKKKKNSSTDVGEIYKEYHSELKGFISKRVNFKEEAEDILQNVFFNLAKIDLIENPIERISSWLYSVARNQIIDRSRKKKEERMPQLKNSEENEFVSDITEILADPANNPEAEYIQSLVWDELEDALSELPEEQRTIIELTELQGFSFKEISESTGIPLNTLISRKRYAILHLRKRMQNTYNEIIRG